MNERLTMLNARLQGARLAAGPVPLSLKDAYQLQAKNRQILGAVGGWKLGGSTLQTREAFNVNEVYCGPIFADAISAANQPVVFPNHIDQPFGEVELVFELSKRVEDMGMRDIATYRGVLACIKRIYVGVEFPWSIFELPLAGLSALVADQCASGVLVVGAKPIPLDSLDFVVSDGQDILASGSTENLVGGPVNILGDFLALAHEQSIRLAKGHLVATGGCTPCVAFPRSKKIEVLCNDRVALSFAIERKRCI